MELLENLQDDHSKVLSRSQLAEIIGIISSAEEDLDLSVADECKIWCELSLEVAMAGGYNDNEDLHTSKHLEVA
jgi:hypothetical protein